MQELKNSPPVTVSLHRAAPTKPSWGAPCNGCGVCCAVRPCPVGVFVLWQRRGPCRALSWLDTEQRYVCGMVRQPRQFLPWLPRRLEAAARACFLRSIAAGAGCDCGIEVE